MLDAFAKLGPVAISLATAFIGALVYRLNAQRLFLDMITARRDAVKEVLDAGEAVLAETKAVVRLIDSPAAHDLPDQSRFWRSLDAATDLFGPEVEKALGRYQGALVEFDSALREVRSDPGVDFVALRRHSDALREVMSSRGNLSRLTKPYTMLGRRGLPILTQLRLRDADHTSIEHTS